MASSASDCTDCLEIHPQYSPLAHGGAAARWRRTVLAMVASACVVSFSFYFARGHGCACTGGKACETWSCDEPLAYSIEDQWPSWPPARLADGIPRDNLPTTEAENAWRQLHKQHIGEATRATAANRVAFLGDSITEGWWRSGFSGRVPSVPQPQSASIWKAHFGRWSPLNLAIGGDRAQDLGWRLQHGLLPPNLQPKVFFVMIGTNDLGSGEEHEVVSSEVQLVLEQLHAARPHATIVLHGLLPRGGDEGIPHTSAFHRSGWWSAAHNNHYDPIRRVNAKLSSFAGRNPQWLKYLDCSHLFLSRAYDVAGGEGKSYIPVELMYDLLHLTPEGYQRWARCLQPKIAEALGESPIQTKQPKRGLQNSISCIGRSCRGEDGGIDLA